MKISKTVLLELIDDITLAMGELLLTHSQIMEGHIDQGEETARRRLDALKLKLQGQKQRLEKLRDANKRKAELEKLRKASKPRP